MFKIAHGLSLALGFMLACANGLVGSERAATLSACAIKAETNVAGQSCSGISQKKQSEENSDRAEDVSAPNIENLFAEIGHAAHLSVCIAANIQVPLILKPPFDSAFSPNISVEVSVKKAAMAACLKNCRPRAPDCAA